MEPNLENFKQPRYTQGHMGNAARAGPGNELKNSLARIRKLTSQNLKTRQREFENLLARVGQSVA